MSSQMSPSSRRSPAPTLPIGLAILPILSAIAIAITFPSQAQAQDQDPPISWKPLFNGRNLDGWHLVNCPPETWTARDGMIVCTGVPTGVMRTDRHYENFELELEWRHLKPQGNAGLFIWSDPITAPGVPFTRSIEVQVLDGRNSESYTSHGDIFAIHGATLEPDRPHPRGSMRCLPSEWRCRPSPEWNHYSLLCSNGIIKLAVNGKVVSGVSQSVPRRGYICLESEGSEVHFRNLRIRELPSTDAGPEETADLAQGFVSLYSGLDLRGWRQDPGHEGHWQPKDWILRYDGESEAQDKSLWSEKEYEDFILICDWRWTAEGKPALRPVIQPDGSTPLDANGQPQTVEVQEAGDSGIYLRGNTKSQVNIWCWPVGSGEVYGYRTDPSQPESVRAGVTPNVAADKPLGQWNRFVITMRGDRLTVDLNGQRVIEEARLPGVPPRGPIGLQDHGSPIDFANIYIKEL